MRTGRAVRSHFIRNMSQLKQFGFDFVSDGQGLCPWNPLGEMISPRPPQLGVYNVKVNLL